MNNIPLIILLTLFTSLSHSSRSEEILLQDAFGLSFLNITLSGADRSEYDVGSHTGSCLAIEMLNTGNKSIRINIPNGNILEPEDTNTQEMIITEGLVVQLDPGVHARRLVRAMCIKMNASAPDGADAFKVRGMARGEMLKVSRWIEENGFQDNTGQDLVWMTSDGLSLNAFRGDSERVKRAQEFICDLRGLDRDQELLKQMKTLNYPEQRYDLNFTFSLKEEARLSLLLYDSKGELTKVLFDREAQPKGGWNIDFSVTGHNLQNRRYEAILYINQRPHSAYDLVYGSGFDPGSLELKRFSEK